MALGNDFADAGKALGDGAVVTAIRGARRPDSATLPLADLAIWSVTQPTPKPFLLPGFIPRQEITLLTGIGGANKSTFGQQLATCCASGRPMLGREVYQCRALYITCEDDESRMHWIQQAICRALNVALAPLVGKLHMSSLRGREENLLATFDGEGRLSASQTFRELQASLRETGAELVILDNAAHMFCGNENDRVQVTQFLNMLYSLCNDFGATVLLIAHPNKAGDSFSGSTAWLNAVRSQIFLSKPDELDPDARVATVNKANYARTDEEMRFRWHDFALVRDDDLPSGTREQLASSAKAFEENQLFLKCLAKCTADRRNVSHKNGANYAPAIFARMIEGKGTKCAAFEAAMERLIHLGQIRFDQQLWLDDYRKWKRGIAAVEACGNPPQKMAEIRAATPAAIPCGDLRQPLPQAIENTRQTGAANTPLIYNTPGAAHGAAPSGDNDGNSPLSRTVDFSRWEQT